MIGNLDSGHYHRKKHCTGTALTVGACGVPISTTVRQREARQPCQLIKDAACCLFSPALADLEGEGIEKLECTSPSSRRLMCWATTILAHACALSFVPLICHYHLAVLHEAQVPVLCQHCFCCPNSKELTITA